MNIGYNNGKIGSRGSVRRAILVAAAAAAVGTAYGGVPLNNLQGTGGIAFNPLAYTAGRPWDGGETNALKGIVSKPQVGAWYVNLTDADINWFALGAAVTLLDRLEISGGYAGINAHNYGDNSISTYNVGAKLRILDENAFDTSWVPAVAVGQDEAGAHFVWKLVKADQEGEYRTVKQRIGTGRLVGTDIGVAGFDDIHTLRDVTPGLSTVAVPLPEVGRMATHLALQPASEKPVVEQVPGEVVLRDSTPPLA